MATSTCAGRAMFSIAKNYMPQGPKGELDVLDTMGKPLLSWKSERAPFAKISLGFHS
jgi:hypothetical protein